MTHTSERTVEVIYHPSDSEYKWVRSSEGWLAGVCEGLAESFNMPVWAMRAIWILGTLLSVGTGLFAYAILAYCLPEKHRVHEAEQKKVLGVCLRLSRALNMEVAVVRVLTIFLALASLGITLVGYLILNFVIPDRPKPMF